MLDRFLDALTGRRLGGALFVLGGLIVAGAVLSARGGDDGDDEAQAGGPAGADRLGPAARADVRLPAHVARDVAGSRHPAARPRPQQRPDVRLAGAGPPRPAVKARHSRRRCASASRRRRSSADGPASSARARSRASSCAAWGSRRRGRSARSRSSADTDYRTYVVTLITPCARRRRRSHEAQQIFATVRFTVPQQRKRG